MRSTVKVMATGGGAHKYYSRLRDELGVEVRREEEMECLILGLGFVIHIPEEVFWFSEELVYKVSHPDPAHPIELERPSPQPPLYHVTFAPEPGSGEAAPHFPCLVVNIGSGVSIVKVDEDGSFERVSGTSLGGGTLWGLLSLLTDANSFDGESARREERCAMGFLGLSPRLPSRRSRRCSVLGHSLSVHTTTHMESACAVHPLPIPPGVTPLLVPLPLQTADGATSQKCSCSPRRATTPQ
jgi:hypothetical protein